MIGKLLSKMNMPARIGLVLSILYGTGVVVLIQHSSLYLGFEEINFLRIKPIIVGLQYYIYVLIPFVGTILPFVISWRCFPQTWVRILGGLIGLLFAAIMIPMMLHYFMPCIGMTDFCGWTWGWLPIAGNFWKLYFYWDCHWIGHSLICLSLCTFCFKMHQLRRRRVRKASRIIMFVMATIGLVWLMYFFNRDFYMNISQAAGGGAPKAGIITIKDPCAEMKSVNALYGSSADEVSKPCFLLYEGDDYILTSEMFLNQLNLKSLNENSIARSVIRHNKSQVVQFSPISYYQLWRKGDALIITNSISGDVVHNLDLHVIGLLTSNRGTIAAECNADCMVTNMPEMVFWIDDAGASRTRASRVSMSPSRGSNIVCHVDFPLVPCQRGVQIWQLEHLMTNSIQSVGIRIDNLPAAPVGFKWDRIVLQFECNFIYPIEFPCSKMLIDERTLMARKGRWDEEELTRRKKKGK